MVMHRIGCEQVWGGISNTDQELETGTLKASLFSQSAEGGKGGDVYFFSVCGMDALTRVAVADVMGHGETVSRISRWVYESLRELMNDWRGQRMVHGLNDRVNDRGIEAMTTLTVASVIAKEGVLYFAYAGHPPMMIRRHNEHVWQEVTHENRSQGCNLPLGVVGDACYDHSQLQIHSGDQLFIYTDGLLEAPDPHGEPFGAERLKSCLAANDDEDPRRLKVGVLDALRHHTGGPMSHDDVTLIALQPF